MNNPRNIHKTVTGAFPTPVVPVVLMMPFVADTTEGWMIAQLKPNGTAAARRNLARQGFAVFMPVLTMTRRKRDRMVTRDEAVFPGYLLVRLAEGSAAADRISYTLGVSRLLLRPDRSPATLPPGFVAALMARCDAEGRLAPDAALAPGDVVRVTQGPFAETVTRVVALDRDGRVSILIAMLGQEVRVSVARNHLGPGSDG